MNDDRPPAVIIHPGEILADEIKARSITTRELAQRMDWPLWEVRTVLKGYAAITERMARALEFALGISAQFWLNLQATYDSRTRDDNKLEPCPHCYEACSKVNGVAQEGAPILMQESAHRPLPDDPLWINFYVQCQWCKMCTGREETARRAINAWNKMSRKLRGTEERNGQG